MSLDKAIKYGKEKRQPYRRAKAIDPWCRNHGNCRWCKEGRLHKNKKREKSILEQMEDVYVFTQK